MRISTNSVIVVEGQNDKALLSRFLNTEIVTTNGVCVSRETLTYLIGLEKHHDIIIITDPDGPGKIVRDKLLTAVPNAKVVLIDKKKSIKKGKVGLAETEIKPLQELLVPLLSLQKQLAPQLTLSDLLDFKTINKNFLLIIRREFPIGDVNNKTMLKRLHYLNVTKTEIENKLNG